MRRYVGMEKPDGEAEAREKLEPFRRNNGALEIQTCAGPFGEKSFVLAAHGGLSAVRTDGDQSRATRRDRNRVNAPECVRSRRSRSISRGCETSGMAKRQ